MCKLSRTINEMNKRQIWFNKKSTLKDLYSHILYIHIFFLLLCTCIVWGHNQKMNCLNYYFKWNRIVNSCDLTKPKDIYSHAKCELQLYVNKSHSSSSSSSRSLSSRFRHFQYSYWRNLYVCCLNTRNSSPFLYF